MLTWDAWSRDVAAMPADEFGDMLHSFSKLDQDDLLHARFRWNTDEFMGLVMRPYVERVSQWFPITGFQTGILRPLEHWTKRAPEVYSELIMGPRGGSKTTTAKAATLHSCIYETEAGVAVFGKNNSDAVGWTKTLNAWISRPSPLMARLWPDLTCSGNENKLSISHGGQPITVHAYGWNTSARGVNEEGARPTLMNLDDVITERNTLSDMSRDRFIEALTGSVMQAGPQEGGLHARWLQTPQHPNDASSRAVRREPEMASWDVRRFKAVWEWPVNDKLWEQCRKVYFDLDTHETKSERRFAAREFYNAHKEAMDEGSRVNDPNRLPILEAYFKLWDMGPEKFGREFQADTRMGANAVFDSSTFARHHTNGTTITTVGGAHVNIPQLEKLCAWDVSDGGGDDGAIGIGYGQANGRTFVQKVELSQAQTTAQVVQVVRACMTHGVRRLHYDATNNTSAVRKELERECEAQGWALDISGIKLTKNKNKRMADTEPDHRSGLISYADDIPAHVLRLFDDLDLRRTDNRDDVPDMVAMLHEGLHGDRVTYSSQPIQ